MANPQVEEGYIRIANEIWDQLTMRDFTKRQRAIIDLVLRLSYGCGKKYAHIPTLNSFALAGVRPNHIRAELEKLEAARVLTWDREAMLFEFNKRYSQWGIPVIQTADNDKLGELIALNLSGRLPKTGSKGEKALPETGSPGDENDTDTSQNGKSDFPKQEHDTSQNGKLVLPEMGTSTPSKAFGDAPFQPPKDKVKDKLKTSKDSKVLTHSLGVKQITSHYHKRIGMLGPTQYEKLRFWHEEKGMEPDAICHAIDVTAEQAERPGISYIEGVLRNWYNDGVRTLADIKSREPPKTEEDFIAAIRAKVARAEEVFT